MQRPQLRQELGWPYSIGGQFVVVMLVVAVANCVNAFLCRHADRKSSSAYYFVGAASLLMAASALLHVIGVTPWLEQAPWMMLIPVAYLIASQLRRGHTEEEPLYWVAQIAVTVILLHIYGVLVQEPNGVFPAIGSHSSFVSGIVFIEAAGCYLLAGTIRRRSINVYLAAAAACAALWQFLGYFGVDEHYYTLLYATLGLICLSVSRAFRRSQPIVIENPTKQIQSRRVPRL